MVRNNLAPFASLVAAAALIAVVPGCTCGSKDKTAEPTVKPAVAMLSQADAPNGLAMRLSEGKLAGSAGSTNKVAKTSALSADALEKLLARLPALESKAGDAVNFALRPASKPAPRPGLDVKGVFPAPGGGPPPSVDASAALEVVRHSPEGDVPLAPHLSVTFSQPMVALTSHADNAQNVPVRLTPQPKGTWRWVGTKTLLFDPDVRFPNATNYSVEIAAGTKGTLGEPLAALKKWTFSTPPLTVKSISPGGGSVDLDPVIIIRFDQRIDKAELVKHVVLQYDGNKHPVRLATSAEINGDASAKSTVELATKDETLDRVLIVKPVAAMPKATSVSVVVRQGAPSAEGPRLTQSDYNHGLNTYGPLSIVEHRCNYGNRCPPQSGWWLRMSNPLDADKFDPKTVTIEPALKGRSVGVSGTMVRIRGLAVGNTTYKVTLPAGLTDKFGQTLGADETREFQVGPATPQLNGPSGLVVLDPYAKTPSLNVFSVNQKKLKVEIRRVKPSDWDAFALYMYRWRDKEPPPLPGKRVFSGEVDTTKGDEELVETAIDLSKALTDGLGHAIVIVRPVKWDNRYEPRVQTWVQATKLGVDASVDHKSMHAHVSELETGAPAAGIELSLHPSGPQAKTSADGTAELELQRPSGATTKKSRDMLIAKRGADVAFLPEQTNWWRNQQLWFPRTLGTSLRWMVFDDRTMYRPGEEVNLKGWVRARNNDLGGDLGLASNAKQATYVVTGPRGNEITKGTTSINALGGFDFKFSLPTTPNLGQARVDIQTSGGRHYHRFQIQEFRRPEYEVTAEVSQGPHTIGTRASITASAQYYAGGGLAAAPVTWSVVATQSSFSPPGHEKFTFGNWVPWWNRGGFGRHGRFGGPSQGPNSQALNGTTTSSGKHVLDIDFLSAKPSRPMSVVATASISDVNRQRWSANATLLVHPSELYVGIRREKVFTEKGKPIEFEMVVANQEGKVVPNTAITATLTRLDWKWKGGRYTEIEADKQTCEKTSASEPVKCSLPANVGGTYKLSAVVVDEMGRPNETSLRTWVTGGKRPPARNVELESVELIPNKENYAPGETATILVRAPFEDAEGIMTIRRSGIVSSKRFTFSGSTHVLEVPIRDGDTPNLHLQVEVVGKAPRLGPNGEPSSALPPRPAFGSGQIRLAIPPLHRTLKLTATPEAAKVEPGAETSVTVVVKDAKGNPAANAEVAIVVVDESVLALSGKTTPDPVAAFYSGRSPGARDYRMRGYVKLAQPEVDAFADNQPTDGDDMMPAMAQAEVTSSADEGATGSGRGFGGAPAGRPSEKNGRQRSPAPKREMRKSDKKMKDGARVSGVLGALGKRNEAQQPNTPIVMRKNFNALASFAAAEPTNASGTVKVAVKIPDNLTRYRIMAVAVNGSREFGSVDSSITARMPLMVRPSPPRFLNFGDEFELPIVIQNQTDNAMNVEVAVRTSNATLTQGAGRALSVPAGDRVEVRFPTKAGMPGTARFQVAVTAGKWADAKSFSMPVWTPATTEAFATYGSIGNAGDQGVISQKVVKPTDVVDEFGGLEITTSSTQLQALTDAVLYLYKYPYECAEQLSSRVLAIAGLRDVLDAFQADGLPSPAKLEASIAKDMERLRNIQHSNGGFGFWNYRDEPWPYLSVHVTHALARAKAKGYPVPSSMLNRAKRYIDNVERHIPHYYGPIARKTIIAYSLYVRKLLGDVDIGKARTVLAGDFDKLPIEALAWVLYTIAKDDGSKATVAKIIRAFDNRATETAGTATFATTMSDGAHLILHSSRRADAIVTEALLEAKPRHDLVEKVVRGLLAHRKRGKWQNTQENVFVLLAMDRYFAEYEKVTPNFVARAWLGDQYAGDHKFKGRTTERHRVDVPMKQLSSAGDDLVLQRDGKGRLYYRLGMRYAPRDLRLPPADHGFAVERVYEGVDKPSDVTRAADGTWKIKAGARVRVRLTMVAESRRYHVALVDPLPAGLEPLNPALKVTGALPTDPKKQVGPILVVESHVVRASEHA